MYSNGVTGVNVHPGKKCDCSKKFKTCRVETKKTSIGPPNGCVIFDLPILLLYNKR